MSLPDRPILITGGTGALGRAVVAELLDRGGTVCACWIVPAERDALADELGEEERLKLVEADLGSDQGAAAAVETTGGGGPLGGLVNLVGGFAAGGKVDAAPAGELERMVELNLMTAYRSCRAALPGMVAGGGGPIVCVGARTALAPFPGGSAYAISKAAVLALVRSLDLEYRDDGIRSNAILPSVIDTPANREASPGADYSKWVEPAAIAKVIGFLIDSDSEPTSGATVPVYGRA